MKSGDVSEMKTRVAKQLQREYNSWCVVAKCKLERTSHGAPSYSCKRESSSPASMDLYTLIYTYMLYCICISMCSEVSSGAATPSTNPPSSLTHQGVSSPSVTRRFHLFVLPQQRARESTSHNHKLLLMLFSCSTLA